LRKRDLPTRGGVRERLAAERARFQEDAAMPLDHEARDLVVALALPIDPPRREAFVAAVTERLAAAPVVGPGVAHQVGRELQRQYFDAPNLHGGQTGWRV
jgi:hypothetical protein